uniref:Ribonuclease P/MRP subunit p30 n=1 Tax=Molossus molossus TaxID=27622 RepID=A0A7J8DRH1_MOLMO|nr:ribonuclease P/MRP subunit p30 [Molossus molossus]
MGQDALLHGEALFVIPTSEWNRITLSCFTHSISSNFCGHTLLIRGRSLHSPSTSVACTHLDVDLVCITVTEKLPFYFKRPPINVAIDRGVGFELVYSPAIKDSTMRRYTISNALNLMQVCKGKNVIISSAAERPLEIRGPYDVANLGLLFGLSESDAKAAVSTNCRAALLHGETRKTAFGIISTVKKPRPSEGNDDSLPACKKAKCED